MTFSIVFKTKMQGKQQIGATCACTCIDMIPVCIEKVIIFFFTKLTMLTTVNYIDLYKNTSILLFFIDSDNIKIKKTHNSHFSYTCIKANLSLCFYNLFVMVGMKHI